VETLAERQAYIKEVSQNRAHSIIDETSHGIPWMYGGEPTVTGEGDKLDYRAKQDHLRETFEQRLVLADSARREQEQIALGQLGERLRALWSDGRRPVAERRRLLYALWEECDAERPAGRAARARIVAFVRERLPAGSQDAFPPTELDGLNRGRREDDRFEPYR
jgi:hypothetical protein